MLTVHRQVRIRLTAAGIAWFFMETLLIVGVFVSSGFTCTVWYKRYL